MDYTQIISYILIVCAALIALTLHEYAHGYVAHLLGDDTAKNSGRLTLNPIKHIDIIGLLALILIHIGWAKPVPINPYNFKNRKNGMLISSLAGPFTNLILAVLFGLLFRVTSFLDLYYLSIFLFIFVQINVGFAIFNILPFPPLDGSKILAAVLPEKWERIFYQYERYLLIVILILYYTGIIPSFIIPIINSITNFLLF